MEINKKTTIFFGLTSAILLIFIFLFIPDNSCKEPESLFNLKKINKELIKMNESKISQDNITLENVNEQLRIDILILKKKLHKAESEIKNQNRKIYFITKENTALYKEINKIKESEIDKLDPSSSSFLKEQGMFYKKKQE